MLSDELLKRVRHIEITTRKVVDQIMAGQYQSHFKGHGVQFSEHRLYVPGDDVRHINWKVSARTKEPLIKKFEEERELSVFLVVDVSASEEFGSDCKLKSEIMAEIGGMLACAATAMGDKVGILFFAGGVEKIVPPQKGRQHVLRMIRDLLSYSVVEAESGDQGVRPKMLLHPKGTNLAGALNATGRIMKHSGVVFVLSDFMASGYEMALKRLARKHDVVAISIHDEREEKMPELGHVLFCDPETGEEGLVDTSSYAFKQWFQESRKKFESDLSSMLKGSRIEFLKISTREDYGQAVVRFFRARARRRR
jgi:uncharacterized protein (DUF58 family)